MKVWVYREKDHEIRFSDVDATWLDKERFELIGTTNMVIEQPKKTVKKEISPVIACPEPILCQIMVSATWIPDNAKNIKLVYEVEE